MIRAVLLSAGLVLVLGLASFGADALPVSVDPSDLVKRNDLLGREVVVDDRVRLFQYHKGTNYDEVYLKRTPVVFRLPPRYRFEHSPDASAARIQGILKREGDGWVCDVTAPPELLPTDLERVNRAVAGLLPRDFESRSAWAHWAEARGKAFNDEVVIKRARELEGEAIRIEAERPAALPAEHWLALAQRARAFHVPEPEARALAHRAFRAMLPLARTADELQALRARIVSFFPLAVPPSANATADTSAWDASYANDPASAYRQAPEAVRAALDHRLCADVTQALLERKAADDPAKGIELADQAAAQLSDRPEVATRLLEEGLKAATRQTGTLRLREVEALAALYKDRLRQPERAKAVLRSWLDEQRNHRLSATDAEGRVALARQYIGLLGDRSTAVDLLQSAWQIDPKSKDVADAFLRLGYRKVNDQWVAPASTHAPEADSNDDARLPAPTSGSLLRLSPREVRTRLGGQPDRIVRVATQGQLIEQWIYRGTTQDQYVNLLHSPGDSVPRVVAHYTLPRATSSPRTSR